MKCTNNKVLTAIIILCALIVHRTNAQYSNDTLSLYEHLYNLNSTPTIFIETEFSKLIRKSNSEEYQPGTIVITTDQDTLLDTNMQVRARGNIRKTVCLLPPLKINLSKKELTALGYTEDDKLKVLLPCDYDREQYSYLFKEHFLYQVYSLIDTNALRSRIVNIQQTRKEKTRSTFRGLLLEDENSYASRKKAKIVSSGKLVYSALERKSFLKMLFFQYMIGNTDWDVEFRHNLEMVKIAGIDRVIPLPYDFDYSGFVNQSYAVPSKKLAIRDVKQRYFFGYPVSDAEFEEMVIFYKRLKPKVQALFRSADYMAKEDKEVGQSYLNGFFDALDDPETLKRKMLGRKKKK